MSINYELAKELKEAGFKMQKLDDWNMVECPFRWGHFMHSDGIPYIFPTLSELIEACGDNLYALYNHVSSWQAYSNSDLWDTEISEGETPEEAVARLWLILNKK